MTSPADSTSPRDLPIWLMRFTNEFQTEIARQVSGSKRLSITLSTTHPDLIESHERLIVDQGGITLDNNRLAALENFPKPPISSINRNPSFDSPHFYSALQVLSRFERFDGELGFEDRNFLVLKQEEFWTFQVENQRPACVVFMDIPHMYYELVLMGVLDRVKIPYFMVYSAVPGHHQILDGRFRPINAKEGKSYKEVLKEKIEETLGGKKLQLDEELEASNSYMVGSRRFLISILDWVRSSPKKIYPYGYFIKKRGRLRFGLATEQDVRFQEVRFRAKVWVFSLVYMLLCVIQKKPRTSSNYKEFVYLPLQSHFENNIHPLNSPTSWDMVIRQALNILSPNQFLKIKEHPVQFLFRPHQSFNRSIGFYLDLAKNTRIQILPVKTDHLRVLSAADAVVTLAQSSTEIEARSLGKVTHVVGRSLLPLAFGHASVASTKNPAGEKTYFPGNIHNGNITDASAISKNILRFVFDLATRDKRSRK